MSHLAQPWQTLVNIVLVGQSYVVQQKLKTLIVFQ